MLEIYEVEEILSRIEGMFSFVIFDQKENNGWKAAGLPWIYTDSLPFLDEFRSGL